MNALTLNSIHKTYPNGFQALKGVTLNIEKGDFFGLLGLNGAGKTTLIGIISHLVQKNSGIISVFDHDLDKDPIKVKKFLGVMPQEANLNPFDTVESILIYQAGYYGLSSREALHNMKSILDRLDLEKKRHSKTKELSGGMKRRLMLARALIHKPQLLILDEPTAGVDIQLRHDLWNYVKELNEDGMTIILTTHYLEEVENLCNNIAILHHGNIIQQGKLSCIQNTFNNVCYILSTNQDIPDSVLKDNMTLINVRKVEINVSQQDELSGFISELSKQGINIQHIDTKNSRLEEFFLQKTGE